MVNGPADGLVSPIPKSRRLLSPSPRPASLAGEEVGLVDAMVNPKAGWGRGILQAVEEELKEQVATGGYRTDRSSADGPPRAFPMGRSHGGETRCAGHRGGGLSDLHLAQFARCHLMRGTRPAGSPDRGRPAGRLRPVHRRGDRVSGPCRGRTPQTAPRTDRDRDRSPRSPGSPRSHLATRPLIPSPSPLPVDRSAIQAAGQLLRARGA